MFFTKHKLIKINYMDENPEVVDVYTMENDFDT